MEEERPHFMAKGRLKSSEEYCLEERIEATIITIITSKRKIKREVKSLNKGKFRVVHGFFQH